MNKKYTFAVTVIVLLLSLYLVRAFSERQLDDVNPQRLCETDLLEKSDVLMVIPLLNNLSIADNKTWCKEILALNKTLGMHGVYHTSGEFSQLRDENYTRRGAEEFRKCFGYSPLIFESPELKLSSENNRLLKSMGFIIRTAKYTFFHRVYHCVDYEKTSYLVGWNSFIGLF